MNNIHDDQINLYLLGNDYLAYKLFGSHLIKDLFDKVVATRFTVYAPNAKEVRLVSSFNNYEGWKHCLTKIHPQGVWQIEIPGNLEWEVYKYEIHLNNGNVLYKTDPFGNFCEMRPSNASIVYDIDNYHWNDSEYIRNKRKPYQEPLLIYEVHLGSWRRTYGKFKKYSEVVDQLIYYVKDHGFTHVELMPIYEHPLDDSWGYQGTGFFAATSRYGSPKDLMYFIDRMHQEGIGVIIDWVLGHICTDDFGLAKFDGTYLYEFNDKKRRVNETWGTLNLDFNKGISRSFMMSALNFWMDYFHVDGFRIDAVSHLIYNTGNKDMGENTGAINFLKQLCYHLYGKDDRLLIMAEDSTDFPHVTKPIDQGGLGFNYKWNMGFMNDVLSYFKEDPIYRKYNHHKITFGLVYAWSEQFVLPFSHDEVVHMKGSLVNKMPGTYEQKFANYRLLLTLWMTHPGKKLIFMGGEFAQFSEWDFKSELDWNLLEYPSHLAQKRYFRDLAHVYLNHSSLYRLDHDPNGFKWLIVDHKDSSVFAYERTDYKESIIIILNMTPNFYSEYEVGVPYEGIYEEILNSNKDIYFGDNQYNGLALKTVNEPRNNQPYHIKVKLGSLSAVLLKYKKN